MSDATVSGECLIQVSGRTYRDGLCRIRLYPGGGFQKEGAIFAAVDIDPSSGTATAYWTGPGPASHAHEPLGAVVRQGGCWVSDSARVCAWRPGTRPR